MTFDPQPFFLSLKLALCTTFILAFLTVPVIYILHFYSGRLLPILKAMVSLPLVLPPTVLGYYLLIFFRPDGLIGSLSEVLFGLRLAFSFPGLVIASLIFSFPFMINPVFSAIENLPSTYQDAAYTLGKSDWNILWRVLLPNIKPSIVIGLVMTFAHTIGEFGVILMIGGNIPDQTRVASIAIYNEVEMLNYDNANIYAATLLAFSFIMLILVYAYQNHRPREII